MIEHVKPAPNPYPSYFWKWPNSLYFQRGLLLALLVHNHPTVPLAQLIGESEEPRRGRRKKEGVASDEAAASES